MEENHTVKINYAIATAVVFQIIFVIFAIATIASILKGKIEAPQISIDNYSDMPKLISIGQNNDSAVLDANLDSFQKDLLSGILYNIVYKNTSGEDIRNKGAKIREGSSHYAYIKDLNIYLLNLVIDIEDLGQSYRIVYRWADSSPNYGVPPDDPAMALCLREDELIYGDFDCKDDYNGLGEDMIVYDLLRYKTFSSVVSATDSAYSKGKPTKIAIILEPDEEPLEDVVVAEVRDYLADLGFNLDNFDYEVDYTIFY